MISKNLIDHWTRLAWLAEEARETLPIPFDVLAREALAAVRFAQRYWAPLRTAEGTELLPGLASAVGNGTFTQELRTELFELYEVMQHAQTTYQLMVSSEPAAPLERAEFVDPELILEARKLAQGLGELSAGPARVGPRPALREALLLRNRLGTMVYERMLQIRAAARFVFRRHPKILREVASQSGRERRAGHRQRQADERSSTSRVNSGPGVAPGRRGGREPAAALAPRPDSSAEAPESDLADTTLLSST